MKKLWIIPIVVFGVLATGWLVNTAFMLISQPSDFDVVSGFVILTGLLMLYVWLGTQLWRKYGIRKISKQGNKILPIILLALIAFGCTRVDPGYVGIKVNYFGSQRGVEDFPAVTGFVWYNPISTSIFEYPTFVQTAIWTKSPHEGKAINEEICFNSKEGLVICGDISLSYTLEITKVPAFYVKFRSDKIDIFTHGFLRNVARDHFNELATSYGVEQLYGEKKEEYLAKVRERINGQVGPYGVKIEQFGFIGAPRLPEGVVNALNAKIQATQDAIRAENEVRQAKAEAQKAIAKAEGEARANELLARSLSPTLLEWRKLTITEHAIAKWDGKRPMVEGQSAGLLLNINPQLSTPQK